MFGLDHNVHITQWVKIAFYLRLQLVSHSIATGEVLKNNELSLDRKQISHPGYYSVVLAFLGQRGGDGRTLFRGNFTLLRNEKCVLKETKGDDEFTEVKREQLPFRISLLSLLCVFIITKFPHWYTRGELRAQ